MCEETKRITIQLIKDIYAREGSLEEKVSLDEYGEHRVPFSAIVYFLLCELDRFQIANKKMSDAYLKIRASVNAWDTSFAPSAEEICLNTESKIRELQLRLQAAKHLYVIELASHYVNVENFEDAIGLAEAKIEQEFRFRRDNPDELA